MTARENQVFIALGANLGNPVAALCRAASRLREFSESPLHRSSLWQSRPVDCPPGSPWFVNAVVGFRPRPGETPEGLLGKLHQIEREFGRKPKQIPNEPRPLDLDLIAFGSEVRRTAQLTLPHPRARERRFVLQPLAELAPDLVLPGQSRTVSELLSALQGEGNETMTLVADAASWEAGNGVARLPGGSPTASRHKAARLRGISGLPCRRRGGDDSGAH